MNTNSICHHGQEPHSCSNFQCSAEGISPQPNTPNDLQRNNNNKNKKDNSETSVKNNNNFVIANKIVPDETVVNTDCNHWRKRQDGFAVDTKASADSTYQGTFPLDFANDTQQ